MYLREKKRKRREKLSYDRERTHERSECLLRKSGESHRERLKILSHGNTLKIEKQKYIYPLLFFTIVSIYK
jgi:hypothetical protein